MNDDDDLEQRCREATMAIKILIKLVGILLLSSGITLLLTVAHLIL